MKLQPTVLQEKHSERRAIVISALVYSMHLMRAESRSKRLNSKQRQMGWQMKYGEKIMKNKKEVVLLFILSLIVGAVIVSSPLVFNISFMLWSGGALTANGLDRTAVQASTNFLFAIVTLSLAMICLAWRWEGRGEPIKGIKALAWLLIGEFFVFFVTPLLLKLSTQL